MFCIVQKSKGFDDIKSEQYGRFILCVGGYFIEGHYAKEDAYAIANHINKLLLSQMRDKIQSEIDLLENDTEHEHNSGFGMK